MKERRLLSFGLTFTFISNFGQTFLISLFVPFFLKTFDLSNAAFGFLFSLATVTTALTLPFLGKWIDRLPLKYFSLWVAAGLLIAALIVSVSWHVSILFIGLLLLRLAGQGLSDHTAQTTMAKYLYDERGKALSIANLGYPMGEALLPLIIAGLIPLVGWRGSWGGISIVIAILFIPMIMSILSGDTHIKTTPGIKETGNKTSGLSNIKMVLRDKRFYLLLPSILLPSFWVTGLFLYQFSIAGQLGWSATLIASAFIAHALSRVVCSLVIGPAIDSFSASKIYPYHLIPLGAGFLVAFLHPGTWSAFVYMSLLGMTLGISGNLKSALFAEMYGAKSLGSIRSLFSSLIVFSAALGPLLLGWLIDLQVTMERILLVAVVTVIVASLLALSTSINKSDTSA